MNDQTALTTIDGEVIELEGPSLFGTTDPVAIVERATAIAKPLADVIRDRKLFKHIGTHDYVFVEGWTLLGSMLGVFAEVEWSRPIEGGWEARAVARTFGGNVVGAAEAMCDRTEPKWRSADDYSIRSMAQTRAVSKALRLPLGFIMPLAGYSATPADELNDESGQGAGLSRTATADTADAEPVPAPATPEVMAAKRVGWAAQFGWSEPALQQAALDATNQSLGELDHDGWAIFATAVVKGGPGLPHDKQPASDEREAAGVVPTATTPAPVDQGAAAESGTDSAGTPAPDGPEVSVPPAVPPVPPKPGSAEYKALPDGGARADARAYWQAPLEVTA